MLGENNSPTNYPWHKHFFIIWENQAFQRGEIVSCSPRRKIPRRSGMLVWPVKSLEFFFQLLLAQNLALHGAQQESRCWNFKKILELGLKKLHLSGDEWGAGNEQKHREMKAWTILSCRKARSLSVLFTLMSFTISPWRSAWLSEYLLNEWKNKWICIGRREG